MRKRPGNSASHLKLIRQLPCVCCLRGDRNDPHHLKSGDARHERGMGMKATDQRAVPMCRLHHDEVERLGSRQEPEYFAYYGIEPHSLADALWKATGDYMKMRRIVMLQHVPGTRA